MRFAARCIATAAVAFLTIPALCANDAASPKANATESAPAASAVASPLAAAAHPGAEILKSARPLAAGESKAAAYPTPSRARNNVQPQRYYPKFEWFLGYSYWQATPERLSNRMAYLHGGSTSFAYNVNRWFGLVADIGGFDDSKLQFVSPGAAVTVDSKGTAYSYMFGPRFSYRKHERFTPFAQALFGGAYATSVTVSGCTGLPSCVPLGTENEFAAMAGAGLDVKLTRHIAWRLVEGDFLLTHFKNPADGGASGWQDNVRLSTGIVFRFGGREAAPAAPPNRPPVASCSSDKPSVFAQSNDTIAITTAASDPDGDPLTYSWTATGGSVDGTGPQVRWRAAGIAPGTYTVTVTVSDGRGGSTTCSVNPTVAARPDRPPTVTLSSDHDTVSAGERVLFTAQGDDPDGDPLTYAWRANCGQVSGSGTTDTLDTAGVNPGVCTVTVRVDDGRGGAADASKAITVQAPPAPDRIKVLETRLALHSIYFQTDRPAATTPDGGVLQSQQEVLLALANDFNEYLVLMPQAHLTLEGHADRRGSVQYNKALTDRRVESAKKFLIEHGVPAANIETQSLGKQENLDADQVKQLVDRNPDLSVEEREKIEGNLLVVVMANNRRVDVSLSTTGQKSIRQFPFNARDALTLLSPEGSK